MAFTYSSGWFHHHPHHHPTQTTSFRKTTTSYAPYSFLRRQRWTFYSRGLFSSSSASSSSLDNNNTTSSSSSFPLSPSPSSSSSSLHPADEDEDEQQKKPDEPEEEEQQLRGLYDANYWELLHDGTLPVDEIHTLSFQVYGPSPTSSSVEDESTTSATTTSWNDGQQQQQPRKNNKATTTTTTKLVGLFLHGGPGAGCNVNHVRFFDPKRYSRIVLLDQRGCGRSTPISCMTNNTLQHLVHDCEILKNYLKIPYWDVVLGGSWGTTIAIAYGQTYPTSIRSMILRGIFLLRPQDVDWLFSSNGGAARRYPQEFESFAQAVNINLNDDNNDNNHDENPLRVLHEYYQRLWAAPNETTRWNAAQSWMKWEYFNSVAYKLPPPPDSSIINNNNNTTKNDSNDVTIMQAIRSWKPPSPIPPVATWNSKNEKWTYESPSRRILTSDELSDLDVPKLDHDDDGDNDDDTFKTIPNALRRGISNGYNNNNNNVDNDDSPRESVPVTPTTPYYLGTTTTTDNTNSSIRLPVQAMLTCFYSTNCEWCRNYVNLLDPQRMSELKSIRYCTIVQGGSDGICPPDTALDLMNAAFWPINNNNNNSSTVLELRIPIHAGHSMYDPLITNELIMATDQMADMLLLSVEDSSYF
eukprot:scaffold4973_cov135-Cylindrotheca_fusiformis.AAC.19